MSPKNAVRTAGMYP